MNAKKALTYLAFFGIGIGLFWLAMQGVEDPEALKRDMSLPRGGASPRRS